MTVSRTLNCAERSIVRRLLKIVKQNQGEYRRVEWTGQIGAPDLLVGFPRLQKFFFIETKRPIGGVLTKHQQKELKFLHECGIEAFVISNLEELEAFEQRLTLVTHAV